MLRVAAAAAALLAAWNPLLPGTGAPVLRVLLRDVSASAGLASEDAAQALADGLGAGDRAAVVHFAEEAVVAAGPAAPGEIRVAGVLPSPWGTGIANALGTAVALRRPGDRLELILDSDFRFTDSAADLDLAVARVLATGGAHLVALPPRLPAEPRSVVLEARGPGRVVVGEAFSIEVSGIARDTSTTVELTMDGAPVETRTIAGPGPFRIAFVRIADAPGTSRFVARAATEGDIPAATATVVVAEAGSVVVFHAGTPRRAIEDAAGRAVTEIDVRSLDAAALAAAVAGHDAVVIDDCASAIRDAAPLRSFTAAGGGLVLVGGPSSFSADANARPGAGLDAFSPLRCAPPGDAACVLYLAIDGSGSMAEPWPGASSGIARDAAARAAADALVRNAPDGTRVFLRRFREFLVPSGPPAEIELSADGRDAAAAIVRALPAPGGSTAFLPVLAEATEVLAEARGRPRAAVLVTDGRSSEDASALRAALRRLLSGGARVTVIVPGDLAADSRDASLLRAAEGAATDVRPATDPAALTAALAEVERSARAGDPFVADRDLEIARAGAGRLAPADVPGRAKRLVRAWTSDDAELLVRTADGLPVVALRREGAGLVAAIAARVPDERWLAGDGGRAMLAAVLRAVRRRGAADVRVEGGLRGILARIDVAPGAPAAATGRMFRAGAEIAAHPLQPEPGGLVSLPDTGGAEWVRFETAGGAEVASAGLDRPAPRELGDVPVADVAALAARLRPAQSGGGRPSAPWFGALAVVLLVAGSVRRIARRTGVKSAARPIR